VRKQLSNAFVQGLKPAATKQIFSDAAVPNLRLIVHPTGRKVWVWHGKVAGTWKTITFGTYPKTGLADARNAVSELNEARLQGNYDIFFDRKRKPGIDHAEPDPRAHCTTDWLFDLYMAAEGGKRASASEKRRTYLREIKPRIGQKKVDDLEHDDLAAIVRNKFNEGFPIASNRLKALLARMFRWAVTVGRDLSGMKHDPAEHLVALSGESSRDRFLSDYEISVLFEALPSIEESFAEVLTVILYTGMRRGEAFGLTWNDIDWSRGAIQIPGSRIKNGEDLVLGLPPTVLALLGERRKRTGRYKLVWPAMRSLSEGCDEGQVLVDTGKEVRGWNRRMTQLNEACRAIASLDGRSFEWFTIHDLRRTLATGMHSLLDDRHMPLIPPAIVERILNHKLTGVRGVYNRWKYYAEKRSALHIWADRLDAIRANEKGRAENL
jgi:integrase